MSARVSGWWSHDRLTGAADRVAGTSVPAVTALHLVEGQGGSRRATDRAAAAVSAAATANGWTPAVIGLDRLGDLVAAGDPELVRVVLCGGDGLVHRAIQLVAGTEVEVAIVPVGTGNDFVRAFQVADPIAAAAAPPGSASVRGVDLLRVGDAYAASVLTGGYSGRVNATANAMRFPPGSQKYTVAAVREIARLRPRDVRLVITTPDGPTREIDEPMTLFAIGNTAWFGGGMKVCPEADPADGIVEVVTVGRLGRLDFVRWLPKVFRGTHVAHRAVTAVAATAVTIETGESLWADGEPVAPAGRTTTVSVAAGALRLVVG